MYNATIHFLKKTALLFFSCEICSVKITITVKFNSHISEIQSTNYPVEFHSHKMQMIWVAMMERGGEINDMLIKKLILSLMSGIGLTAFNRINAKLPLKKFIFFVFNKSLKNLYNTTTIMKSKVESDYHIER